MTKCACRAEEGRAGTGVELQFSQVCVRVETRPRTASHLLHVSLGSVCLRERITPHTLFPVLVAPQGVIREGLSAMNAAASAMAWCRAHAAAPAAPPEPLFQLTYEKKPFGLNCDYKWVAPRRPGAGRPSVPRRPPLVAGCGRRARRWRWCTARRWPAGRRRSRAAPGGRRGRGRRTPTRTCGTPRSSGS